MAGQVEVQIHKAVFTVGAGSQFFVPRGTSQLLNPDYYASKNINLNVGNQYRIDNTGTREARLFFCHGKEIPASNDA